ncbi:VOC family protein [Jeotgalibacillus sp. S-D1]|uniref:VOC family protein n=1 Tax=Jeotgalibacillus sp. S-D1 TaxID=2552189 RepID=UPI001059C0AB|nr:VOC family protein [Jeotgalibacillus sp. S-D1]TDL31784.1 VOC family protein [Jeotgalibacillus sp. S-D1]
MSNSPVQAVGQIGVPVRNLKRANQFYRDRLGLKFLFETDTMSFFDCEGVRLFLSLPEKEKFARASSVIYFTVGDIHQTYKKWHADGVEFIGEPHRINKSGNTETWMAFFKDPEENTLAIMSELAV